MKMGGAVTSTSAFKERSQAGKMKKMGEEADSAQMEGINADVGKIKEAAEMQEAMRSVLREFIKKD